MNAITISDTLLAAVADGNVVYISNHLHCWRITAKTAQRFESVGMPVLKTKAGELYMASGRKYVCVSGCAIKVMPA